MRLCVMASEFPVRSQTFVMHHVTGMLDRDLDVQIIGHKGDEAAWQSLGAYEPQLKNASGIPRFRSSSLRDCKASYVYRIMAMLIGLAISRASMCFDSARKP